MDISENTALYSLIGITFGGDGNSTFGLPDLRGRVPIHTGNGYPLGQPGGLEAVALLCTIRVAVSEAGPFTFRLTDISGRTLWEENKVMGPGLNTIELRQTELLMRGVYMLTVMGKQAQETVKLVKE